uniref:Uncharacterized protein n=1 Tax=Glossina pallidipes TaxID=7398 RepID=A0A1A9ZI30_GLOPL
MPEVGEFMLSFRFPSRVCSKKSACNLNSLLFVAVVPVRDIDMVILLQCLQQLKGKAVENQMGISNDSHSWLCKVISLSLPLNGLVVGCTHSPADDANPFRVLIRVLVGISNDSHSWLCKVVSLILPLNGLVVGCTHSPADDASPFVAFKNTDLNKCILAAIEFCFHFKIAWGSLKPHIHLVKSPHYCKQAAIDPYGHLLLNNITFSYSCLEPPPLALTLHPPSILERMDDSFIATCSDT